MKTGATLWWLAGVLIVASRTMAVAGDPADFDRDIQPLLSNYCYKCHGFDASARVNDLRLDRAATATGLLESGKRAIVPGDPAGSELLARVTADDPDLRMPPPETNQRLSTAQLKQLRNWIQAGAEYKPHWAYVRPRRPAPPAVGPWARGPIDRFVSARIEAAGLQPSRPASRRQLVRRLYLDLTGLPPRIEQVEQFLADPAPDAYERLIDRLLASPNYGERMAQNWLDAARYADTTGYAADAPRTQWLYRDYVIDAFNSDLPFDQFTIEQLAGDLLPEATVEQRIATGFHRQSTQALGNNPRKEEFRVKGIVDRLLTTGRVWMGMSLECAECHDHKFDPVTQREYYQLFAIFNNVPHLGEAFGVHGPRIKVLPRTLRTRRQKLQEQIAKLKESLSRQVAGVAQRQRRWEADPNRLPAAAPAREPNGHWLTNGSLSDTAARWKSVRLAGADGRPVAPNWSRDAPLRGHTSLVLNGRSHIRVELPSGAAPRGDLTIAAWVRTRAKVATIVSKYDWRAGQRSFVFGIGGEAEPNSPPARLFAWLSSARDKFQGIEVYGSQAVNDDRWRHVAVVFRAGKSVELYVDGVRDEAAQVKGTVPASLAVADRKLVIAAGYNNSRTPGAFPLSGKLSDVQLFDAAVDPVRLLGKLPPAVERALATPVSRRSPQQARAIADYYLLIDPQLAAQRRRLAQLQAEYRAVDRFAVEAQVMEELSNPRTTHILIRGDFKNRGERVEPGVPSILPPLRSKRPVDRLAFARWLVSAEHPLTARVTVNRIWQHFFSQGLVRTDTDFGFQGERPTHPKLLDWLACEFIDSGWDVKRLVRRIVTSATYRQDSAFRRDLVAADPQNRWLARAPRFRLPAEQLRDVALAVSGTLDTRVGGPSVYPQQPDGLYAERTTAAMGPFKINWPTSEPKDRYRRGMYVFWKRTILYPSLKAFDAPTRGTCVTRRSTTNTPLQALVALNDPVFLEAAGAFAERILREASDQRFVTRLNHAFRASLSRRPAADEIRQFEAFYSARVQEFQQQPATAMKLRQYIGIKRPRSRIDGVTDAQWAAWTLIGSTLLNLDEAVSRE